MVWGIENVFMNDRSFEIEMVEWWVSEEVRALGKGYF